MASLKYKQYRIDNETLEWLPEKRYGVPLSIIRLGLLLIPDLVFGYLLRKLAGDSQGKIEGMTPKEFIRIIYKICSEMAEARGSSTDRASVIFAMEDDKQKSVLLVE